MHLFDFFLNKSTYSSSLIYAVGIKRDMFLYTITIPVNVLLDFILRCFFFHTRIATLSSYQSGYLSQINNLYK